MRRHHPLSDLLSLLKPRSYITADFDAGGEWALSLDDLAGRIKC
ncbi:cupin domain-containing protein [Xaviernesmea oryzae]|nr:cupin domain-containing protein [Xaviernesmea oryzae]